MAERRCEAGWHTRVAGLAAMVPWLQTPDGTEPWGIFFWQPEKESFLQQRDNGSGKMLSFNGIVMLLTFFFKQRSSSWRRCFEVHAGAAPGKSGIHLTCTLSPGAPVTVSIFKLQQNYLIKTGASKRDRPFTLLAKMRLERPMNK